MATRKTPEKETEQDLVEKPEATSKTEAIREALGQGMKSPSQIARHIKDIHGLDVTPNYVSAIKRKTKGKRRGRKPAQPKAPKTSLDAAIDFVERVGGVPAAKSLLEKMERIKNL